MAYKNKFWQSLPLNFSLRKPVPVMLQTETTECGLVCMAMISSYHGKKCNVLSMRNDFGLSSRGSTLEELYNIASNLKMGFRALSLEMEELNNLKLPCIVHWNFNHFVVVTCVARKTVTLHDPALGLRVIPMEDFSKSFTGVAIELWPEVGFIKKRQKTLIQARELMNSIDGFKTALFKIFLLSLVIESISLLIPVGTQLVMDHAIPAVDYGLLKLVCFGLFILTILQTLISSWRSWSVMIIDSFTDIQWKDSLFHHLIKLPLSWFDRRKVGDIQSRFNSLDAIRQTFIHDITGCIINIIMSIGSFSLMVIYGGWLSLIVVAFTSFYVILRVCTYSRYRQLTEEAIVKSANASSYFTETIYGITTIRAQGLTAKRRKHRMGLLLDATSASISVEKFDMFFQVISVFLSSADNILILWLGINQVMDRQMTIGAFVAFGIFRGMFSSRAINLADVLLGLKIQTLHNERVADIALSTSEDDSPSLTSFPPIEAMELSIENVTFKYDNFSPNIISNLSLKIHPGESVAITGLSGCGKSTLMKLMAGLIPPDSGHIFASGRDIHALGINNYRAYISCILQEDRLFSGSLRENIAGFSDEIDDDLVMECAKVSFIHSDIMSLPMGYESFIGELGEGLSGGQKQRVFIARALYRKPCILFMDEATSHLDEVNEKLINEAISNLGMTRVIIAHRPSTIASADRVFNL
ncbi:TPA: peptidase domain-containing ABC transporter [Citrobacter freundii]